MLNYCQDSKSIFNHSKNSKILADPTLDIPVICKYDFIDSVKKIHEGLTQDNKNDFLKYLNMFNSICNVMYITDGDKRSEIVSQICISMNGYWSCYYRAALFDAICKKNPEKALIPFLKYGDETKIKEAIAYWKSGRAFIAFLNKYVKINFSSELTKFIGDLIKDKKRDKIKGLRREQKEEIKRLKKRKRGDELYVSNKKQKTE